MHTRWNYSDTQRVPGGITASRDPGAAGPTQVERQLDHLLRRHGRAPFTAVPRADRQRDRKMYVDLQIEAEMLHQAGICAAPTSILPSWPNRRRDTEDSATSDSIHIVSIA